jgi:hypothetical protein
MLRNGKALPRFVESRQVERLVKQRNRQEDEELQTLLDEYERLNRVASAALSTVNIRSRPNWHQFYEASEQMTLAVEEIRKLNGH